MAAVNLKASFFKGLSNIHAGDRAKQFPFLASFTHKMTWHALQLFRQRLGVLAGSQNAVFPQELFVLELTLISSRRRHGKASRDEKIAAIPIRHIDNVTHVSHMLYITHQNDFHCLSPSRTALLAERIGPTYHACLLFRAAENGGADGENRPRDQTGRRPCTRSH